VLNTLGKGNFFGEIAIFCESKRISFVQAETFSVMAVLKKKDIDRIVQSFPQVAVEFKTEGDKRKKATEAIENMNILKKTHEQASEEEILMQYYKDNEDDEESEEESSEEVEEEMPPKKKSLAQKMNFIEKRGTMILLQGSAEASSIKKINNKKKQN
jgi:CRP-like cAMP-binding protein